MIRPSLLIAFGTLALNTAHAADTCNRVQAQREVMAVHETAAEKVRKESRAKPTLEKQKVGRVLVAKAAPEETDVDALQEDLDKLVKILEKSPGSACDEALKLRKKYAL